MNYVNFFYNEIEKKYKLRKIKFFDEEIKVFVRDLVQQAKEHYSKLPKPRSCSLKTYINVWLNEEIAYDIAKKTIGNPLDFNNPPDELKAIANFYQKYPPQKNKLDLNIDLNDMNKRWLLVVEERNKFALNRGYKSRLDMSMKNYKIPVSEYNKFSKNVDEIIRFYKPMVDLNIPRRGLDYFLNVFRKNEVFFQKYENKIEIKIGEFSETKYQKITDNFVITLKKDARVDCQMLDLIHELGHLNSMIEILGQDKLLKTGVYYLEKRAIKKEISFIMKYFPEMMPIKIDNILQILQQTLFEIEIYKNPKKDPDKIYLKYLKKCFGINGKNVNKLGYLFNQDILYKSLYQIVYSVAYANTLNYFKERI